jgi:hypothetical protein
MSSGPTPPRSGGQADLTAGLRLTEEEQKWVAKLLSDPTYFPIEFRTWIKQFVEGADIRITASQIEGGGGSNVATGLPAGIVLGVAASAAIPVDCLTCDGTPKLRTDYPALFGVLGSTWGAGDGSTTFNLPDYRDRALYGQGGRVALGAAGTDQVAFGSRGGAAHHHPFNQTSDPNGTHSHGGSVSGGGHEHSYDRRDTLTIQQGTQGGFVGVSGNTNVGGTTSGGGGHSHGINPDGSHTHRVQGDTGGGFAETASFAGVIWVITTGAS